jgi:hypothetical protein
VARAGIALGIFAILVGLAIGYAMLAYPENLNPAYPRWVALLAPAAFVSGGLLACAHAAGRPGLVAMAFRILALCLLAIVNWGAVFSNHIHCRETVSFLGLALLDRYPSEVDCRDSLRVLVIGIDAAVLLVTAAFVGRKWMSTRRGDSQ